ncbi:MAG: AmmeMemoRadiSam system protein B [Ignavibacteria bacterium]|nr:AmmeMemoRadiSam system protein B [Ignavibacteria bacterium]
MISVRQPSVAGMFYPADPDALSRDIDRMLTDAPAKETGGSIVGLIVPHAGYPYSGHVAASAYKLLRKTSFATAVIVSPSHREFFDGISIYDGSAYRTPLGEVALDVTLREELVSDDDVISISILGHGAEHAIEVQLPFLQKVLGEMKILPIVIGNQRRDYCYHLARKLAEHLKGKNVLLIASTDLSHYHPYETAEMFDAIVMRNVAAFDDDGLMTNLEARRAEACGGGPTVTVLAASKLLGANVVKILSHCNSGDITGDRHAVVGYLSAVLLHTN